MRSRESGLRRNEVKEEGTQEARQERGRLRREVYREGLSTC